MVINRQADPALHQAAKDEAMCDLEFSSLSRCGQSWETTRGIWVLVKRRREGGETYKNNISGFLPRHIRPLNGFDLRDKPVQSLGNLLH